MGTIKDLFDLSEKFIVDRLSPTVEAQLMAGLLPPAGGRLFWNGAAVEDDYEAFAAQARYLGHHDAIKPVLTVFENLAFWAGLYGVAESKVAAAVEKALAAFALSALRDIPGIMLSAGQKRRANLARLLVAPAGVWLLDEPTTALDKASVAVFEGVIAAHRAAGGMVVLSTHTDIVVADSTELFMTQFAADPAHAARQVHFAADLFDDQDTAR